MKVYQHLTLYLDDISKEVMITKIDSLLPLIWIRDKQRENELLIKFQDNKQYAYSTKENPDLPYARLWLAENEKGQLYVSNIVPDEMGKLTLEEYNSILNSFVDILKSDSSIRYELTKGDVDLEDFLPANVAKKLKTFSIAANHSTGYGHPLDFDRWLDFVTAFYINKCECDRKIGWIRRWLHEEAGWLIGTADHLASQLDYAISVLQFHDKVSDDD